MPGPLSTHVSSGGGSRSRAAVAVPYVTGGLVWALLALAVPAHFVFQTIAVRVSWVPSAMWAGLASSLAALVIYGLPRWHDDSAQRPQVLAAATAGAAMIVMVPALVLANRFTDVPSGSVVAFWTTTGWGVLLLLADPGRSLVRRTILPATMVLAFAGAAAVLGNWERPSSLNLFVRYGSEQLVLVAAGVIFVAGATVLTRLAQRELRGQSYSWAAVGALVASGLLGGYALLSGAGIAYPASLWPYPVSAAFLVLLTWAAMRRLGQHPTAAAFVVGPALLSGITLIEAQLGMRGPQPLLIDKVLWGAVMLAMTAIFVVVWRALAPAHQGEPEHRDGLRETPVALGPVWRGVAAATASLAVVAATWSLLSPGLAAAVRGELTEGGSFAADFTFAGVQTIGGWFAVALAFLGAGALVSAQLKLMTRARSALLFIGGLVAAAAWHALRYTPVHTWTRFVPVDVQQDYGSPYARITFSAVPVTAQWVAVVAALMTIAVIEIAILRAHARPQRTWSEEG